MRGAGRGATLAAGLLLAACGVGDFDSEDLIRDQLNEARQQWSRAGYEDYSFVIRRACGDCQGGTQFARIVVQNNGRVSGTFFESGQPVPAGELSLYPTVIELFDFIDSAIRQDFDQITVQYDALLGYPTSIYLDRVAETLNDETAYTAHTLQELTGS